MAEASRIVICIGERIAKQVSRDSVNIESVPSWYLVSEVEEKEGPLKQGAVNAASISSGPGPIRERGC